MTRFADRMSPVVAHCVVLRERDDSPSGVSL